MSAIFLKRINRALDELGGTAFVAQLLGISQPTVSEWRSGRRLIPLARVRELVTYASAHGKAVTREQLRPDVF